MKKALCLVVLLTATRSALAQNPPVAAPTTPAAQAAPGTAAQIPTAGAALKELLSGSAHPLTLKIKDMKPEDWRRFTLTGQTDDGISSYLPLIVGMMGGGGAPPTETAAVYYTQAQTVTLGAETYLVAYRPLLKQPDFAALMAMNGAAQPPVEQMLSEKMTLESSVSLSLLNVKKIGGMADIRPFDAAQEVAERAAADKAMADMLQANVAQNGVGVDQAEKPEPLVAPKIRAAIAADKTLTAEGNSIAVEEAENLITLRGVVVSAKVKEQAGQVVQKYLKQNGLGFKVDNQLQVLDAEVVKALNTPQTRRKAPGSNAEKKKK